MIKKTFRLGFIPVNLNPQATFYLKIARMAIQSRSFFKY